MAFPQSTDWGRLGVRNFAQFAEMNPATFAGQELFVDIGTALVTYRSDGQLWASHTGAPVVFPTAVAQSARRNTTMLQTALSRGGVITLDTPGVYEFDVSASPLVLPSDTELCVCAGVQMRVAAGSPSSLFTNSFARHPGVIVPPGKASYAAASGGYANMFVIRVIDMAQADAALFPVDSYVSSVVKGHGAGGSQAAAFNYRGYRGVYRVVTQTLAGAASSIEFLIPPIYPGSNDNASTNTMRLYPANKNIRVHGLGTIDGNGGNARQTPIDGLTAGSGNPQSCVMWWRHVYNLSVEKLHFRRGITWTIGSNYVRNYIVRDVTMELRDPPVFDSIDLVHLSGFHQNVLVENIEGGSGDNTVGLTIDVTDSVAQANNPFNFAYQDPGDMYDVTLNRIHAEAVSEDGTLGIIGIYGPAAYLYRNIIINGVTGAGSNAVQLANYAATNQTQLRIDRISISNVRAMLGGAQVGLTDNAAFDINEFILDGVVTVQEQVPAYQASDTATGSIRSLIMRNVTFAPYNGTTFTRTAPVVRLGGTNIAALQISNMENIAQAVNVRAIEAGGPGNIGKVGIRDCSATGSGTGAGLAALWADTGSGTAATPVYTNSTSNGTPL